MAASSIILVGAPDSGKTNYLARFWEAVRSGHGFLRATQLPDSIVYVEDALGHLLAGQFAPRSDTNLDGSTASCSITVSERERSADAPTEIFVPDVSGELWAESVETCELPAAWMDRLRSAVGALLFVRVGSDQNVDPPDWVTARRLLKLDLGPGKPTNEDKAQISTAVQLCELIRFLEFALGTNTDVASPRVAILVTAWDRLDPRTAKKGPRAFLAGEYPLVGGRIDDVSRLDISVFGVSVVGGDFDDDGFKARFLKGRLQEFGYVVREQLGEFREEPDLTIPVSWVLQGYCKV